MSVVTNVILKTALREEHRILELNALSLGGQGFVSCDSPSLPRGWYAGSKMLECEIYPGAFNFLVLENLIDAIKRTPWEEPEYVQLFIQEQEENRFREISLDFELRV